MVGALSTTPTPRRAALAGLLIGAAIALPLAALGKFGGGESDEAAALLAAFVAMPSTMLFDELDWGHWASQWTAFILIAVPLNGALLGLAAGLIGKTVRLRWLAWFGLLCALWSGVFVASGAWARTH